MTIASDLRAAAFDWDICGSCTCDDCAASRAHAVRLRAHAATIERVEKEMRDPAFPYGATHQQLCEWADALKGGAT